MYVMRARMHYMRASHTRNTYARPKLACTVRRVKAHLCFLFRIPYSLLLRIMTPEHSLCDCAPKKKVTTTLSIPVLTRFTRFSHFSDAPRFPFQCKASSITSRTPTMSHHSGKKRKVKFNRFEHSARPGGRCRGQTRYSS